jgi:hypothetical protein
MAGYIIYHPARVTASFGNLVVYYDKPIGNQDPYIWNNSFLHTYCHITQMKSEVEDINFWVNGDTFPEFNHLFCDLVFVVHEKVKWQKPNLIDRSDPIVESDEAYNDHYKWGKYEHCFKKRGRFTLKADPFRSFQPQTKENALIDIVPFLNEMGISLEELRNKMRSGKGSQPFPLKDRQVAITLYDNIERAATIKLKGHILQEVRQNHNKLSSHKKIIKNCE